MKRYIALLVMLLVFLPYAPAQAQLRSANPQGQPQTPSQGQEDALRRRVRAAGPVWITGQQDVLNGGQALRFYAQALSVGGGAWWNNPNLIARLGITEDQKTKLDRAFENHRQRLASDAELLDKEEAQLAKLLAADPIDRNAILSQTDRVVQARSELERENSLMTLEMREVLTSAQWMQVPQPNTRQPYLAVAPGRNSQSGGFGRGAAPGGQRGGGQRQQ